MDVDRDVVVRMNPNLSDDQIDELIEQRIPELTFEYGGSVRMSTAVYKQYKAEARDLDQYRKSVHVIEAFGEEDFKPFAENAKTKGRNTNITIAPNHDTTKSITLSNLELTIYSHLYMGR